MIAEHIRVEIRHRGASTIISIPAEDAARVAEVIFAAPNAAKRLSVTAPSGMHISAERIGGPLPGARTYRRRDILTDC